MCWISTTAPAATFWTWSGGRSHLIRSSSTRRRRRTISRSCAPTFTEEEIKASLATDRRGLLHADIHGMTTRSETTGEPNRVDQDGVAIEPDDKESPPFYEFGLYQPAMVAGYPRLVGVQNLMIPAKTDGYGPAQGTAYPTNGGDLAKYLFPHVIARGAEDEPGRQRRRRRGAGCRRRCTMKAARCRPIGCTTS